MAQAPPGMPMGHGVRVMHGELGQWWKNSEVAQKLQLTNQQLTKLDQIFYQHRMNLIDYQAETEKQDLKLQALVDADSPDEAQINQQMDQVLESRGKLEREFTTMTLDLRRVHPQQPFEPPLPKGHPPTQHHRRQPELRHRPRIEAARQRRSSGSVEC